MYFVFFKFEIAADVLSGILSNIAKLPRIIKDRRRVQKIRKVSDKKITEYMKKYSVELGMFMKGQGKHLLR